jgi:hypothetical protein
LGKFQETFASGSATISENDEFPLTILVGASLNRFPHPGHVNARRLDAPRKRVIARVRRITPFQ